MNWYLKVLKQYADFNGRARRKEYWMFALFNVLIICALYIFIGIGTAMDISFISIVFSALVMIYSLLVFIPNIAVTVRRLHDTGKEWTYILLGLIPIIGPFWLLAIMAQEGTPGRNEFGPNPKEETPDSNQFGSEPMEETV